MPIMRLPLPVMMMVIVMMATTANFPRVFVFLELPEKMGNRFPPVMTRGIVTVVFVGFPLGYVLPVILMPPATVTMSVGTAGSVGNLPKVV